jgi:23S rRNA (pseudouridine1915-N3)-methyltransferase
MKIVILAVGRIKKDPAAALVEEYVRRAGRFAPVEVQEVRASRGSSSADPIATEGERILAALRDRDVVVACDERGRQMTTSALMGFLDERARDPGTGRLVFVIGGADGLAAPVLERARDRLALSRLTLPHRLARVILAEQLYRALSLKAGHPYHRE